MNERTWTLREGVERGDPEQRLPPRPGVLVLYSQAAVPGDGTYPVRGELTVGRSADCDIFLEDRGMSRVHAALGRVDDGRVVVRDSNSSNGTFVNGVRIASEATLGPDDLVRCGQTLLRWVDDLRPFARWRHQAPIGQLVGGPTLRRVLAELEAFARSDLELLITGESGTGKELAARYAHDASGRGGPFVAVNCAALPEELFEAELFGAIKGAFTGAAGDRPGLFASAAGGTLFLDEIGELPLALQPKLLRAVEDKQVRPVGGTRATRVDVRLVAATNRDLAGAASAGELRGDLYHRLRGAHVRLPPLRERREEIPLLLEALLGRAATPAPPEGASTLLVERLMLHRWPGNVRELDRVLREAAARAGADGSPQLMLKHLREELQQAPPQGATAGADANADQVLEAIREALTRHRGNVSRAAADLGMHRARVYTILRERGLSAEHFR